MSKVKYIKNDLESDYRQELGDTQETELDFDLYFQKLMTKSLNVLPHHKAPMRKFAESKGLTKATERQFDEVFKNY